ncbi:MAG: putative metal-dependent hydrolase [Balneolaceae bacterium]|nr:putative metal-dependent hydrolase [Balneolaceae bacterium]
MNKKYPIGQLSYSEDYTDDELDNWLNDIALLPDRIRDEIQGCSDDILLTPYRDGSWNTRQLISHLIDSHSNAINRIKFALTEDSPSIKPYDQDAWVEIEDQFGLPLEMNLDLLENIHEKLVRMYYSLSEADWKRTYTKEGSGTYTLSHSAALYAWHSNHHLAHIRLVTREKANN